LSSDLMTSSQNL